MKIYLKHLNGEQETLDVNPDDTIKSIRKMLGIKNELSYQGSILAGGMTISELQIRKYAILTVENKLVHTRYGMEDYEIQILVGILVFGLIFGYAFYANREMLLSYVPSVVAVLFLGGLLLIINQVFYYFAPTIVTLLVLGYAVAVFPQYRESVSHPCDALGKQIERWDGKKYFDAIVSSESFVKHKDLSIMNVIASIAPSSTGAVIQAQLSKNLKLTHVPPPLQCAVYYYILEYAPQQDHEILAHSILTNQNIVYT